ncbi:MAG: RluA family pseudouridine synthase [bacterium]
MVVDLVVDSNYRRADLYLSKVLNISRNQIQRLIEERALNLNGKTFKASSPLKCGDIIRGELPEKAETSYLEPLDIPLNILYEDEHILILNKEKGIVVHPANGHKKDTLVNAVINHCKDLKGIGGVLRPGVVHRLDKDTAGVMVFAKDEESYKELQRQFKNREVKKRYLVLVCGTPKRPEDRIITNIGRSEKDRKKFAVTKEGKEAVTQYKVLKTNQEISLLQVEIKTGRTHQIRVHMKYIGNPVLGDTFYNKKIKDIEVKDKNLNDLIKNLRGQALFAEYLEFKHPVKGLVMGFHGVMPEDMKNIIERLDANAVDK